MKTGAPQSIFEWTGFYFGGNLGYGGGGFGPGTYPLPQHGVVFPHSLTGVFGGYQAGYNFQLSNKIVLGGEADVFFTGPLDRPKLVSPFHNTFDYTSTVRGRVGYAFGALLPCVSGGLALGRTRIDINDPDGNPAAKKSQMHFGWVWGTGVEFVLGEGWSGKVEYNYIDLGARTYAFDGMPLPDTTVQPRVQALKLGLNYRLGDLGRFPASASGTLVLSGLDWNVHGQTTLITQGYPRFRAPYQGANSLPGGGLGRQTWTVSAMVGWRLWDGGEVYFNPEVAQGFGIGSTFGLAGFANGEAQKGGAAYPKFRAQRYYFRQTFGLGGGEKDVADAFGQLAGKRDIDRITVTVGRFAVGDFFDGNSYAKDARADFMNWAMWAPAAYDFPADLPGITRGAVIELNRKDWALRAGIFQVPSAPGSDVLTFNTGGAVIEFEQRYVIFDQPGKFRLGAFANRARHREPSCALAVAGARSRRRRRTPGYARTPVADARCPAGCPGRCDQRPEIRPARIRRICESRRKE